MDPFGKQKTVKMSKELSHKLSERHPRPRRMSSVNVKEIPKVKQVRASGINYFLGKTKYTEKVKVENEDNKKEKFTKRKVSLIEHEQEFMHEEHFQDRDTPIKQTQNGFLELYSPRAKRPLKVRTSLNTV